MLEVGSQAVHGPQNSLCYLSLPTVLPPPLPGTAQCGEPDHSQPLIV